MLSFKTFIAESTEDKGIFKAVFMAGTPGAGKTYTMKKVSDGSLSPRVVNTDKMYEFLAKSKNIDIGKGSDKDSLRWVLDKSKELTKAQLAMYLNSMLPLFVDGTSSNINNLLHRIGILEFFGYDVGMVWVDTDIDVAIERAAKRDRHVPEEVIHRIYDAADENKQYYKGKFNFFHEIKNGHGELDNAAVEEAFRKVKGFFTADIKNPIGKRNLKTLEDSGKKYLIPELYSSEEINKHLDTWYRK